MPSAKPSLRARYDAFDPAHLDDPYPLWALARATEPVFYADSLGAWVVTAHAVVQEVLQDPKRFLSAGLTSVRETPPEVKAVLDEIPPRRPALRATDPPEHTRLRTVTQAGVSPRRVAGMEAGTRAIAHRLLDAAGADRRCDFYAAFAYPFPLAVIASLLGFAQSAEEQLHYWANCRLELAWGNAELAEWTRAARGVVAFYRFVEAEIVRRQTAPSDDVLSDLVVSNAAADEPLDLDDMVEAVQGLISAGHETTANWIALSLFHLLSERSRWERRGYDPRRRGDRCRRACVRRARFGAPHVRPRPARVSGCDVGAARRPRRVRGARRASAGRATRAVRDQLRSQRDAADAEGTADRMVAQRGFAVGRSSSISSKSGMSVRSVASVRKRSARSR